MQERCARGRVVNIGNAAFVTALNLITVTLFSVDFTDYDSDVCEELQMMECIHGVGKIAAAPNLADFFPVLQMLDPQGLKREAEFYLGKLLGIIGEVINQRLELREAASHEKRSDMLEALLDLRQGSEYELSLEEIKHLFLVRLLSVSSTPLPHVNFGPNDMCSSRVAQFLGVN